MKKLLLSAVLFSAMAFGQKIDSVASVKMTEFNKDYFNDKSRNLKIGKVELNDGNTISVGDTVTIGRPGGVDYNVNSYTLKKTAAFDNIIYGTAWGSLMKGIRYADTEITGQEFKVVKIRGGLAMGNTGISAMMIPINSKLGVDRYITILKLEKAIRSGEVMLKNAKMTKEQAIRALEEKKKLLDLGLIKQEEFEQLKEKLKPIILQ